MGEKPDEIPENKLKLSEIPLIAWDEPEGFKNTQLVVLSACSTAIQKRGVIIQLESADYAMVPLTITNAFESIKVHSIISTLWDVSDEGTKDFMILFYQYMQKHGYEVGKALSETKRAYIKNYSKNPYYWSPFVLLGDYR